MGVFMTGIALAFAIQFAKKRKFKLKEFIINVVIFSAFIFVIDYLKSKFHFSIPFLDKIPDEYKFWFGGLLFFIGCCAFSIMGWRQFKIQRKNEPK